MLLTGTEPGKQRQDDGSRKMAAGQDLAGLAEILRGVGVTIRERRSFYRDLKAMTAKERFSAVITTLILLTHVTRGAAARAR